VQVSAVVAAAAAPPAAAERPRDDDAAKAKAKGGAEGEDRPALARSENDVAEGDDDAADGSNSETSASDASSEPEPVAERERERELSGSGADAENVATREAAAAPSTGVDTGNEHQIVSAPSVGGAAARAEVGGVVPARVPDSRAVVTGAAEVAAWSRADAQTQTAYRSFRCGIAWLRALTAWQRRRARRARRAAPTARDGPRLPTPTTPRAMTTLLGSYLLCRHLAVALAKIPSFLS
jgi:hypothetical protein